MTIQNQDASDVREHRAQLVTASRAIGVHQPRPFALKEEPAQFVIGLPARAEEVGQALGELGVLGLPGRQQLPLRLLLHGGNVE